MKLSFAEINVSLFLLNQSRSLCNFRSLRNWSVSFFIVAAMANYLGLQMYFVLCFSYSLSQFTTLRVISTYFLRNATVVAANSLVPGAESWLPVTLTNWDPAISC